MRRFFLCILLLTAPLFAQGRLALEDAVAQALASHPELEAGRQRVRASEGVRTQVGLRPNPSFTFQQENMRGAPEGLGYWDWTDTFAFVSQTIEMGKKRQRRVESATSDVERAELEQELTRLSISARVRQAYWAAAGAQRIYELFLESAKNFLLTVQYHEVRVREGAMAEADLLRIRLESERLNMARNMAFLEAERARIHLFREMGQSDIPESAEYDALEAPGDDTLTSDVQLALEQRAEMKLARLAVRQTEALLNLANANKNPNLSALAGYKRSGGYNSLVAGMTIDLPVFDRNQGEIAAAGSRIAASRAEAASMAAVVRAEVALAQKDYEIRRKQILESLQPMQEQAKESSDIAQAAYREGGWDLLRLLDAETMRIETQSLYYRALAEFRQSVAALNTAMGVQ